MIMEQQKKSIVNFQKTACNPGKKKNRLTPFGFIDFTLAYPD